MTTTDIRTALELVALIRQIALAWEPDACLLGNMTAGQLACAADLLERLAKPEPDGPAVPEGREPASVDEDPTDAELLELMPQQFRDDLATVSRLAAHGTSPDVTPGLFRVSLNTGALDYARAVLARWGRK